MTDKPEGQLDQKFDYSDLTHIETLPSNNELQIRYPDISAFIEASGLIGVNAEFVLDRKPRPETIITHVSIEGRDMSTHQNAAVKLDAVLKVPDNTNLADVFNATMESLTNADNSEGQTRFCEFHADKRKDTVLISTPNGQVLAALPYTTGLILITNKGTLPAQEEGENTGLAIVPDAFSEISPDSQVIDFCVAITEFIEAADKACIEAKKANKPIVYTYNLIGRAKEISENTAITIGRVATIPTRNVAMIPEQEKLDETLAVRFADIAGYEKEVALLQRALTISKNPEYAKARFGLSPTRGIVIQGPSGTGKTLMAQACATELGAKLITVGNEDIIAPNIGESARNLDKVFKEAFASDEPAVLLFENVDAILGSGSVGTDKGMMATFKRHVRNSPNTKVLVIATAPSAGAMVGGPDISSLFETKLNISLPSESDRLAIFAKLITEGSAKVFLGSEDSHNVPLPLRSNDYYRVLGDDIDIAELAALTSEFSGADINDVIKLSKIACFERELATGELSLICQADILQAIQALRQK